MAKLTDEDFANEGARGIARKIDDLGRIVIPKEYRKVFAIRNGDILDMTLEGDSIVLRKLERSCVFCQSLDDLGMFRGKLVCAQCFAQLKNEPQTAEGEPNGFSGTDTAQRAI